MTTSELFQKHFGDTPAAGLFHPNMEAFFEDLKQECIKEDAEKAKMLTEEQANEVMRVTIHDNVLPVKVYDKI